MKKWLKISLIVLGVFILINIISLIIGLNFLPVNTGPEISVLEKIGNECEKYGGGWLNSSQECEGISKENCDLMQGTFNECASACRNNPEAEFCTMQCVQVCEF